MKEIALNGEIKPGTKPFKTFVVKTVLFVLGRGFQTIAARDAEVKAEVDGWDNKLSIMFEISPNGPYMTLQKIDGSLRYMGLVKVNADLAVCFKNMDAAFSVFTAQISTPQSYAEHRISVRGDLPKVMSLMRCLDIVEFYLFPGLIARRIIKRMPQMTLKKFGLRLYTYFLGIPFGL